MKPGYVDVHCHLASEHWGDGLSGAMERASQAGITNFMQGGIGPQDWARQETLPFEGILPCFGLHPYWIAEASAADCEQAMKELKEKVGSAVLLGETGLDFREQYLRQGKAHQENFFRAQLLLAKETRKPCVLHIVRAHREALEILKKSSQRFFVHSFNSSWKVASRYLDLGALLSVGGPLCHPKNKALHEAVQKTPAERILIESDSPDQAPYGWPFKTNEPASILLVAERLSELKGGKAADWLEQSRENFLQLIEP